MKKLIELLAKNVVSNQKEVKVEESDSDSQQIVKLSVADDDMGKIIGKNGRVIKAIRTLLKIKAIKEGKRVYLELAEQEK
jgi:predicted RNA-binding protein YlqC (UPF0109 family)